MSLFEGLFSQQPTGAKEGSSGLFGTVSKFKAPAAQEDAAPAPKKEKKEKKHKESNPVDDPVKKQRKEKRATQPEEKLASAAAAKPKQPKASKSSKNKGKTAAVQQVGGKVKSDSRKRKADRAGDAGDGSAASPHRHESLSSGSAPAGIADKKVKKLHTLPDSADIPAEDADSEDVKPSKKKRSAVQEVVAAAEPQPQLVLGLGGEKKKNPLSRKQLREGVTLEDVAAISSSNGSSDKPKSSKKAKAAAEAEAEPSGEEADGEEGVPAAGASEVEAEDDDTAEVVDSEDEEAVAAASSSKREKLSPEEEAAKLARTIFVGNLPASTTIKSIKQLFSRCGEVDSVRLRSVPINLESKIPRKSAILSKQIDVARGPAKGFVVFMEASATTAALAMNGRLVGQNHIRVDLASPPSKQSGGKAAGSEYDPTRSIFVGNLSFQTQDEELIALFGSGAAADKMPELRNSVEAVRLVRDKENQIGKGFAFILFKTKLAARAALSMDKHVLRRRPLRVTRVTTRTTPGSSKPATGPAAAAQAKKGPVTSTSMGGSKSAAALLLARPEEWQGTQTKGIHKGVRGIKEMGGTPVKGSKVVPQNRSRSGKRPSVEARKAKILAGPQAPMPALKTFPKKKGSGARPWNAASPGVGGGGVKKPRHVPRS